MRNYLHNAALAPWSAGGRPLRWVPTTQVQHQHASCLNDDVMVAAMGFGWLFEPGFSLGLSANTVHLPYKGDGH